MIISSKIVDLRMKNRNVSHCFGLILAIYIIQRASEASEADSQSCSIEISDIYRYVRVRPKISHALLIT